jgi:hypothetical protein
MKMGDEREDIYVGGKLASLDDGMTFLLPFSLIHFRRGLACFSGSIFRGFFNEFDADRLLPYSETP